MGSGRTDGPNDKNNNSNTDNKIEVYILNVLINRFCWRGILTFREDLRDVATNRFKRQSLGDIFSGNMCYSVTCVGVCWYGFWFQSVFVLKGKVNLFRPNFYKGDKMKQNVLRSISGDVNKVFDYYVVLNRKLLVT